MMKLMKLLTLALLCGAGVAINTLYVLCVLHTFCGGLYLVLVLILVLAIQDHF